MSGGSYNYLYCHVSGLDTQRPDIENMEKRLQASGYYAAARATREVMRYMDAAERAAQALQDVWQAVEWADSNDWGEEEVQKAVTEFSPWPPKLAGEQHAEETRNHES